MDKLLRSDCFYSFYGLIIKVCCEGERVEDEIERFLRPFPFEKLNAYSGSVHIELEINISDTPPAIPVTISEPFIYADLSIYELDKSVYLTDGISDFKIYTQSCKGIIHLHHSFSDKPAVAKSNFFLIGLMYLLSSQGLYGLHGAGLMNINKGYLLLGDSGSGKSSLTLSLVNGGWHYQSDDALLLRESSEGIESLAFREQFYITPAAVRQYPEIEAHLDKSDSVENEKQFFDMQMIYPDLFCPVCFPKVLIYTRIVSQSESTLVPLDKTSSLINLMKQSESLCINRKGAAKHVEVLKRLVYQADSYQLLAGHDLYDEPEKILSILP